jgi:hypothetical protein
MPGEPIAKRCSLEFGGDLDRRVVLGAQNQDASVMKSGAPLFITLAVLFRV